MSSPDGRPTFVEATNPPVWERSWPTVIYANRAVDFVATLKSVADARNPDNKIFFNGEWV
jgi:hypothetical protein